MTALLVYGSELAHFSLSVDEELFSYAGDMAWKIAVAQGRWGLGAIAYVFPGTAAIPFLPTALFCATLATSAVLFAACLVRSRRRALVFVAMFVSCPIWPHIVEFNISWGIGIGLLATAGALLCLRTGRASGVASAVALLTLATSIYQAVLVLFVAVALLRLLVPSERASHANWRSGWAIHGRETGFAAAAVAALAAGILYVVTSKAALVLTGIKLSYVQNFFRWSDLISLHGTGLRMAQIRLFRLALGTDPIYLGRGLAVLLLPAFGLLVALVAALGPGKTRVAWRLSGAAVVAAVAAVLAAPLLISGGGAPARSMLAVPAAYAFLAAWAFGRHRLLDTVCSVALGLALLNNAWISTSLFYTDTLARQRDAVLAADLIPKIEAIRVTSGAKTARVTVVGSLRYESGGPFHRVENFGTSFFEHGGGSVFRILSYLRLMGLEHAIPIRYSDLPQAHPRIEQMPAWPLEGAVAPVDGVVVVKLGEPTYKQQQGDES